MEELLIDQEIMIKELKYFYPDKDYESMSAIEIETAFNVHAEQNSIEIEAGKLVKLTDSAMYISTPDGYQPLGDFYIKKNRDIYKVKLTNGFSCKSSCDHLFETSNGWKKASELSKTDNILTPEGFFKIKSIKHIGNEDVYDWEVLHENHRYWAGDGLSSHNTGKTFLTLNACREAQKMGYNVIYCDSEAAVDEDIIKNFGVNPEAFRYQPVSTPQEVRHFVANLCENLKKLKTKGNEIPKLMLVLDSLGNLATHKERNDALSGSEKKDMTKQQELRSLFRVITTDLAEMKIPFLITNHTYACSLGNTPVLMSDGSYKELSNIKVGENVFTINGDKEVQDIFKYENVRTIKLFFEDDITFECSPQHKFLIGEDYTKEESWITAEELNEGDYVLKT